VRSIISCGEPLNAEVVTFFREQWGVTVMDHYGSSELGLPIGNFNAIDMAVKPGSMGRPLPGCTVAIVDDEGAILPRGSSGLIATMPPPDAMYALGYWNNPEAERLLRRQGWIVTGDIGHEDSDGYYWFEGRNDDVIKSAGYRIGPFEVESALLTHPAVAEAAVVGKPDPARGQLSGVCRAARGLRRQPGAARGDEGSRAPRGGGACLAARDRVVSVLPKTITGKIQRFVLRSADAAQPAGTPSMIRYEAIAPGRWSDKLTFSPAIRVGNLLFISGTTATDENRKIVGIGDIAEQTRQIFRKWATILHAAGADFDNIVETTDYYVTLEGYAKTADVRREFFRHPYPAATGVQVAGLIRPEALIEIKGIAVLDSVRG
jgi:enamine deaminase RidA (YjgF/YER057c/UK114 family)